MTLQGIETYYIGPTNYKPGRVKARAYSSSAVVEWDYALNIECNHRRAAMALIQKNAWPVTGWIQGGAAGKDGGYYFVHHGDTRRL